jgi:hypothetical protein
VLPSGREIDVVYFEDAPPAESAPLEHCPGCQADFVAPVDWRELAAGSWELSLRCANCGHEHTDAYTQDQVDAFEASLDEAAEAIAEDLRRLTRANMESEADRFIAALDAGQIWPMDF